MWPSVWTEWPMPWMSLSPMASSSNWLSHVLTCVLCMPTLTLHVPTLTTMCPHLPSTQPTLPSTCPSSPSTCPHSPTLVLHVLTLILHVLTLILHPTHWSFQLLAFWHTHTLSQLTPLNLLWHIGYPGSQFSRKLYAAWHLCFNLNKHTVPSLCQIITHIHRPKAPIPHFAVGKSIAKLFLHLCIPTQTVLSTGRQGDCLPVTVPIPTDNHITSLRNKRTTEGLTSNFLLISLTFMGQMTTHQPLSALARHGCPVPWPLPRLCFPASCSPSSSLISKASLLFLTLTN